MKKTLKRVALFVRDGNESRQCAKMVERVFVKEGFEIVTEDYDLAVAVGGDGTFLRMVKESNFDSAVVYVGINTGTLGFLQEVKMDEIDSFVSEIKNDYYKIDTLGVQETTVVHRSGSSKFYSLNETVLRARDLKLLKAEIRIAGDFLERFVGDGLIVATSVGSTAHNLSYGGSIVYDTFSSLQITPMAPINSSVYRSLANSLIIPHQKDISIVPFDNEDLIVTVDGNHHFFDKVREVTTIINSRTISRMRLSHHSFAQKVNEKLLIE